MGLGDVATIIQGFKQGGIVGGAGAGYSTAALFQLQIISKLLDISVGTANFIGIAVGLAALLLGGNGLFNHVDPKTEPNIFDAQRYFQESRT